MKKQDDFNIKENLDQNLKDEREPIKLNKNNNNILLEERVFGKDLKNSRDNVKPIFNNKINFININDNNGAKNKKVSECE
jgi:hypothetical protein